MKKILFSLLSIALILFSCKKDKDEDPAPGPVPQTAQQTLQAHFWRLAEMEIDLNADTNGDGQTDYNIHSSEPADSCSDNVFFHFRTSGYYVTEVTGINPCGEVSDSMMYSLVNDQTILFSNSDTAHVISLTGTALHLKYYFDILGYSGYAIEKYIYP
jgi:hypothetical protein